MSRAEPTPLSVLAAAAFLTLSPTLSATAPDAADVVTQEIDVRLAEVEVVVTDRQGHPVAGLTAADFEVFQDKRPVELTHFRAVTGGRGAAPGPAPAAPQASPADGPGDPSGRLYLVVYVDRRYLEPGDLSDVREALKGFLRESVGPGDRTMLVTADDALELAQGFTTVPELVVSQLDAVRERPGGGRLAREYLSILQDMRRTKNEGTDLAARDPRASARTFLARVQAYAAEVQGELRRTTAQLEQLIGSIAGLPGRRAVLYVGGRVPSVFSRLLFDAWEESFGRHSSLQIPDTPGGLDPAGGEDDAQAAASDPVLDSVSAAGASYEVQSGRLVQEVAQAASANGIVFHTLDASGLRGSAALFSAPGDAVLGARGTVPRATPTLAPGSAADSLGTLAALSRETGGLTFAGSRDFPGALARIDSGLKTYYSLGFAPLPAEKESSEIEVRLRGDRKKLRVRHRPLLALKDRDTLAAERTVSALLLEEMDNPLEVQITAGEGERTDGGWRLPVSVTLPLSRLALVADGKAHTGRLSIFAAAGGLDRPGAVIKAVVPVRIANQDLLTSLGRRVAYQLDLTLADGPRKIAVTVRDDFRPMSSTAVVSFGTGVPAGGSTP